MSNTLNLKSVLEDSRYDVLKLRDMQQHTGSTALNLTHGLIMGKPSANKPLLIADSNLSGTDVGYDLERLEYVFFVGCQLVKANFRLLSIFRCGFICCDLTDADFSGSEMSSVLILECTLDRTTMIKMRSVSIDVRGEGISKMRLEGNFRCDPPQQDGTVRLFVLTFFWETPPCLSRLERVFFQYAIILPSK